MAGDAPETEASRILKDLAPDLARPVHAFLYGGSPGPLPRDDNYMAASLRLRELHNALDNAQLQRKAHYTRAVLAVAVRLQAVIIYETLKALRVTDSTAA